MTDPTFRGVRGILTPLPQDRVIERYTIALAVAVVAVLMRGLLDPVLGHVAFYVTVYIAVAFSAIVCGLAPAVLSALLGFLGVFYWFVDPRLSFALDRPSEIHGFVGFALVCGVLILLGDANRVKQLRLNQSISELTTEGAHRKEAEAQLKETQEQLERRVQQRTGELSQALAMLQSEMEVRKEAEAQFRDLSVRLMTLQDEERRRIARDLHDTTGQTLSALKMILASLQHSAHGIPGISGLIDDLDALAEEALQEIRTTSYLLHPPLLDEAGFASAARWFVEGFSKRSNIEVGCDIPQQSERLSKECELVLFRVLQESLTNCGASCSMYYPEASHAFATSAGWPTAPAAICSHSAVFFFTSRSRPPRHRPRTSSPPGSALAAKARSTSSNDSPLPNSSSLSPGLQVHMTHPDPLPNPATLACLFPRVPDVCPGLEKRLLRRFHHRHRLALYAWLAHAFLFPIPQRSLPSPTTSTLQAIENP